MKCMKEEEEEEEEEDVVVGRSRAAAAAAAGWTLRGKHLSRLLLRWLVRSAVIVIQ
jgi:hypothetical protein